MKFVIDLNRRRTKMANPTIDESEYEEFVRTHEFQLILNNIPKHFYRRLYEKMKFEIFDSGQYFQLCPIDDGDEIEPRTAGDSHHDADDDDDPAVARHVVEVLRDEAVVDDAAGQRRNRERSNRRDQQEGDSERQAYRIAQEKGQQAPQRPHRPGIEPVRARLLAAGGCSGVGDLL